MLTYTWEIQRQHHGLWSHQAIAGQPADPRGHEKSDLIPEDFARSIAHRHQLTTETGPLRVVVWNRVGVGHRPAATLTVN